MIHEALIGISDGIRTYNGNGLRVTVLHPTAGGANQFNLRGIMRIMENGVLIDVPFGQDIPQAAGSVTTAILPLQNGFLISANVFYSAFAYQGQLLCKIEIVQGIDTTAPFPIKTLALDYVTSGRPCSYPESGIINPINGRGHVTTLAGANPAPGANFTVSCPVNARRRIIAVSCRFVTSAVAGNRIVYVAVNAAGLPFTHIATGSNQGPGVTTDYHFTLYGAPSYGGAAIMWPLSDSMYLTSGVALLIAIVAPDAGDQLSQIQVRYEEWVEWN